MEGSSQHLLSDDYTEVYRRLPLKLQLAYGVGHVFNDICASMWFTYLLVYFQFVLEFSTGQAGFMILVGQVADAIATPFVGFHSDQSDNFWFCRFGKRKTWHLIGTICVLLAFPFIFSPCVNCTPETDKWAQIFYYCVFIVIFQFGWAAVQISHLSLIPELTPNEHDRTQLTAIRWRQDRLVCSIGFAGSRPPCEKWFSSYKPQFITICGLDGYCKTPSNFNSAISDAVSMRCFKNPGKELGSLFGK